MAFTDITDTIAVNRKLAKLTNTATAMYWAEILEISKQVQRKKTYDATSGYWKLNRSFITEDLGISVEDQVLAESILVKLGFMEVSDTDPNTVKLHVNAFYSVITDQSSDVLAMLKKDVAAKATDKAKAKKLGTIATMQKIASADVQDTDLVNALSGWVQAIYDAKNFLTKAVIEDFKNKLFTYTNDKSAQLEIIRWATLKAYKDFNWALTYYERNSAGGSRIGVIQQAATEVSDTKF